MHSKFMASRHLRTDKGTTIMSRPSITVLTMGGTIASIGASAVATTIYELDAARDPVTDFMPVLAEQAEVTLEPFAHLASHDIAVEMIFVLARRIAALRAKGLSQGIVVTHGTDTLEETAYLLDLLLEPGAPVVITGAARPSSALSADGPLNLLNAVRVAAAPAAAGRGVLVCMNDRIAAARFVTKTHTSATDAFKAIEQGYLGIITGSEITFFDHGAVADRPRFDRDLPIELPRVEIIACHLGMSPSFLDFAIAEGAAGIVFAGTGNGSIPAALKPSLAKAREAGIIVVRSSRVGSGAVSAGKIDDEYATIPAGLLNPQKARLLLMLALRESADRDSVAAIFARA